MTFKSSGTGAGMDKSIPKILEREGNETRLTYNFAHLRSTKESPTVRNVNILTLGGTGWYLMVLGQYRTVRVDI